MKTFVVTIIVIGILFLSIFIIAIFIEEPVELSLISDSCFGKTYFCVIGEKITLNVKLNHGAKINQDTNLKITSTMGGVQENFQFLRNETVKEVSINTNPIAIPNKYEFYLDSDAFSYSSNFKNFFLWVKHFLSNPQSKEKVNFDYPKMILEIVGDRCNKNQGTYYLERVTLTNKQNDAQSINCTIRIYVDEDTKINNNLFIYNDYNETLDYYDTTYDLLNEKNGLTRQQITFTTAPDTQIINSFALPVCNFDGNIIEIKNKIKFIAKDCKVK